MPHSTVKLQQSHTRRDIKLRDLSHPAHPFTCRQFARRCTAHKLRTRAAQRQTSRANKRQQQNGQAEPDEVPFLDRFHISVTGFPFPLGPFFQRRTICKEVDKGSLWLFEQEQALGFSNVTTVVRMTVIKLKSGGLWVHAPIAPTRECVRLVKQLGLPIEHIVLPTFAYEHKIFLGPFSRAFPEAKVWIAPRQWSWPLPLPVQFFGIFPSGGVIEEDDQELPWSSELDHKVFVSAIGGASAGVGPYVEIAFLHKASKTLVVTDAVVSIPPEAPQIVRSANLLEAGGPLPGLIRALSSLDAQGSFREKLFNSKLEQPVSSQDAQIKLGWKRMALQILYFVPGNLLDPEASFQALSKKLLVSPVLQTLVYSKNPEGSRDWIDRINTWSYKRVIPAHFAAPIAAGPKDLRQAFQFVWDMQADRPTQAQDAPTQPSENIFAKLFSKQKEEPFRPPVTDMRALNGLEDILTKAGVFSK